mmetsp:Transcript_8916/g.9894  ORF Transcript_8916/g.9894 Transcript_8916/m.9894 type:complete len:385 (-) Transcript_8916:8-1162(-)
MFKSSNYKVPESNGCKNLRFQQGVFYMANVTSVKIVLKKFHRSTCGVLQAVNIWGWVSPSCNNDIGKQIMQRHEQHQRQQQQRFNSQNFLPNATSVLENMMPQLRGTSSSAGMIPLNNNMITSDGNIPKAYVDPITHALMVAPVLLPSGHVVDQSTINRHLMNKGTNPFTGVPMYMSQIQQHTSLRLEIQKFLAERRFNNERNMPSGNTHMPNSPRRANMASGTNNPSISPRSGLLHSLARPSSPYKFPLRDQASHKRKARARGGDEGGIHPQATALSRGGRSIPMFRGLKTNTNKRKRKRDSDMDVDDGRQPDTDEITQDFKRLRRPSMCGICESCDAQCILKFPCGHVYCKPCLLGNTSNPTTCKYCTTSFAYSQIKRVHLV